MYIQSINVYKRVNILFIFYFKVFLVWNDLAFVDKHNFEDKNNNNSILSFINGKMHLYVRVFDQVSSVYSYESRLCRLTRSK